jgi:hypothetical protein
MVSSDFYWTGTKHETVPFEKEVEILKLRIHMAGSMLKMARQPTPATHTDRMIENAIGYLEGTIQP